FPPPLTPRGKYPRNSTFGSRITPADPDALAAEKNAVAEYVVDNYLGPGASVFIGDGSSTFFVALHMFKRKMHATMWTNHLAIAHEFSLLPSTDRGLIGMEMHLAGGQVDRDLMMTYGRRARNDVARWAREAQCVILSVRALFPDRGPAGREQQSLVIKQKAINAALKSGARIVLVVDHAKLSYPNYENQPLVFPLRTSWRDLAPSENFFVVTNNDPGTVFKRNVKALREQIMKSADRVVLVPPVP
ncbi:MAG: hypothetical protein ABIP48_09375, partial [Planctomycetota bacterium]